MSLTQKKYPIGALNEDKAPWRCFLRLLTRFLDSRITENPLRLSTAQVAMHRDSQHTPQWPQMKICPEILCCSRSKGSGLLLRDFILSAWAPVLIWTLPRRYFNERKGLAITVRRFRRSLFSGDQPFSRANLSIIESQTFVLDSVL